MKSKNKLKGGLSDKMSLNDIANNHKISLEKLKIELKKGKEVEKEHTKDLSKATEIAMDHLSEDPKYYSKLKKIEVGEKWSEKYKKSIDCNNPKGFSQKAHCQGRKKKETKEAMGADSSGSFEPSFGTSIIKRKIGTIPNSKEYNKQEEFSEATDASSSGSFDVPLFGTTTKGRKNPLSIGGPETIRKSRAVKDKNFPKWGGPGGVFIKIKDKCKKFPYCNQGDINAIEILRESIEDTSKKHGIPVKELENIVLNEIKKIFISYEK